MADGAEYNGNGLWRAMETSEYGGVDETSTGFGEQVRNVPEDKIPLRAIKNTYLQDFVNMQYAVFDEKGKLLFPVVDLTKSFSRAG